MFGLIEISQGIKNFLLSSKTLLENHFKLSLKNSLEKKIKFQNTILAFFQILCKHSCKGSILQNNL
jgi:hypothetical protein